MITIANYYNGTRTEDEIKELQGFYGVTVDGKWGAESTDAAFGMSADEAWEIYEMETKPKVEVFPVTEPKPKKEKETNVLTSTVWEPPKEENTSDRGGGFGTTRTGGGFSWEKEEKDSGIDWNEGWEDEEKKPATATSDKYGWKEFGKEMAYNAERAAAGVLGIAEGVTDFLGAGGYNLLESATSLGGLLKNPVSEWAGKEADKFLDNSITRDYEQNIRERYQPSEQVEKGGNLVQGTAGLLTTIGTGMGIKKVAGALGAGAANLTGQAGQAAQTAAYGKGIAGVSAAGSAATEARQEGADSEAALKYGAAIGLSEYLTESLAGGIPGWGEGKLSGVIQKVTESPMVKNVLEYLGEGGESALATFLEPYIKRAVYDPEAENATAGEIAESALEGIFFSALLDGGLKALESADGLGEMVKSKTAPAQKDGAGEYRATKPENVELPTVPMIDLSTKEFADSDGKVPSVGNSLRGEAIKRARERLGLNESSAAYIPAINVTRNGEEYVLKITRASLNKMLSPADGGIVPLESIVVIDNLERIVSNGVWFEGQGDRRNRDQILGIDHLKTTVYIDGAPYEVDMRVRLVKGNQKVESENVLYFFTPEELIAIKKVDTTTPTGERRALTGESEKRSTFYKSIIPEREGKVKESDPLDEGWYDD